MGWVLFVIWITINGDTGAMDARFFVTEISARCVPKAPELLAPKIRKDPIGDR